jgi:hypothetical protein
MALTRPRYSQIYDTDYKQSVRVATTADVGNLLATGNMTNSIDGKTLVDNDRVLVKNQDDKKQNGIYTVTSAGSGSNGTWVRAKDANASDKMTSGMTTVVSEGDSNAAKTFRLTTPDPITLGTTELTFADPFIISATAGGANTYVQFNDVSQLGGVAGFTFNKTSNLLTVSGNITSNSYFIGNGSQLSGIDATSIQNGTSNVKVYSSDNVAVSTNSVANVIVIGATNTVITGNVLPSANVTYDLGSPSQRWRTGYFDAGTIDLGGSTISVGVTGFTFTVAGSGTPTTLSANGSMTGTLLTAAQPNITSLGTLASLGVTGNVTASYFLGNGSQLTGIDATSIQNGTSNIRAFSSSSVTVSIAGAPNVATFSSTGLTVAGNLTVNGTTTTVNSTTLDVADLNITVAKGAANPTAANGAGLTVDGAGATLLYTSATDTWNFNKGIIGTLNTGSQPNINSIGTLSVLNVSGNITTTSGKFIGDGSQLTGLPSGYTDSDVETYLPTHTGNVSANYFIGDGSQLTGVQAGAVYTASATTPISPSPNDIWYDTSTDTIFKYISDGTNTVWVDVAGQPLNVNIGPIQGSSLNITGNGTVSGTLNIGSAISIASNTTAIINGGFSGQGNIGSSAAPFNKLFAVATSAQYADLAEKYTSDFDYQPGTVVIFGGTHEVTISTHSHDTRVAGVVTTAPAYLMNESIDGVAIALTGRVPCRVLGPVNKGDRLVSSQHTGVAQRLSTNLYEPGCIIGKSLEEINSNEIKTIEIAIGRF